MLLRSVEVSGRQGHAWLCPKIALGPTKQGLGLCHPVGTSLLGNLPFGGDSLPFQGSFPQRFLVFSPPESFLVQPEVSELPVVTVTSLPLCPLLIFWHRLHLSGPSKTID